MKIWVDADACPAPVKSILCKAAERLQIQTTFLANHWIQTPPSAVIHSQQVPKGFDVADNEIWIAHWPSARADRTTRRSGFGPLLS